jgi:hypothetical protein
MPVGVRPAGDEDLPRVADALGVRGEHDALRAEHVGQLVDELGALHRPPS